jgi:SagB-type dehydrogenase family enzyme
MARGTGRTFMEQTQYQHLGPSDQQRGLPQPPLELGYNPSAHCINLPRPEGLIVPPTDLADAIDRRRSVRAYADAPLTQAELSWLLWTTQGIQREISRPATLRPVPSAGARHAFETYLLLPRVEEVPVGLYRFAAGEHKLVELSLEPDLVERAVAALYDQEMVQDSAATFIWGAVMYRMYWRYGERGYRYIFLDAGHVCQNLYLAAEAIDCGVCAIAAFQDEALNGLLGLDGKLQFAVYAATVGKKKHGGAL